MKSRLLNDIDSNIKGFKRRCRMRLARFIREKCPSSLRNFDKKYPQLGSAKNTIIRLANILIIKTIFVVVVLPIVVVVTLIESIKYLFRKGK